MALITCPDCKRAVSSLAVACPSCARPIASDPTLAAVPSRDEPVVPLPLKEREGEPSIDPGALARQYRERVTARTEGVDKTCLRCKKDVTEDIFRVKSARGYMCGDCQDAEIEARMTAQERSRRMIFGTLILLILGFVVLGAMTMTSLLGSTKGKK
jgi:hypothetical protein